MAVQRTLALVKPDAVAAGHHFKILGEIEAAGLSIVALKKLTLTEKQARLFYHVHCERGFFGEVVSFMASGPIYAAVLEGDDAVKRWRDLMGPTDSEKARTDAPLSIRARYGKDKQFNATHGSDHPVNAEFEIGLLFGDL